MKESLEKYVLNTLFVSPTIGVELLELNVDKYSEHPIVRPILLFVSQYYKTHHAIPSIDLVAEHFPNATDFFAEVFELTPDPEWALAEVEKVVKMDRVKKLIELVLKSQSEEVDPLDIWERGRELLRLRPKEKSVDYFSEFPRPYYQTFADNRMIIPTGIRKLDEYLGGGVRKGWFCYIMGGTGMGKSAFLINVSATAITFNKKVLYISLEMDIPSLLLRFDARMSNLPMKDLLDPNIAPTLYAKVLEKRNEYLEAGLKLIYYPPRQVTVTKIPSIIESSRMEGYDPDLVVIDFADYFAPLTRRDKKYEEVADTFQILPGIAKEFGVAIWTASEVGKTFMYDERITIDKGYGSSEKGFGADLVLGLSATQEELRLGSIRLTIAKSRHSRSLEDIAVSFDRERMIMR